MTNSDVTTEPTLNTTVLMSASALFMGGLGIATSIFPRALLSALDVQSNEATLLLMNVVGALYLGFAVLNWMAREHLIGGIYSRPVAMGNVIHFIAAAVPLIQYLTTGSLNIALAIVAAGYAIFAISFGYVAFGSGRSCG
jgi:hypothetical protein